MSVGVPEAIPLEASGGIPVGTPKILLPKCLWKFLHYASTNFMTDFNRNSWKDSRKDELLEGFPYQFP